MSEREETGRQESRPITTLLPELRDLRQHLYERLPQPQSPEETGAEIFRLEALQYALASARHDLLELATLQSEAVDEILRRVAIMSPMGSIPVETGGSVVIHSLGDSEREAMSFAADHFLDAARRSQNALVDQLSMALSQQLPQSLANVIANLKSGKLTLPRSIGPLLISYWDGHGKRLKDYRDLGQHHALVASDARVTEYPDRPPRVFLAIPNNPEEKSYRRLSFQRPTVQALPYIRLEFLELLRVVRSVAVELLATRPPLGERVYTVALRSPIEFGPGTEMDGHSVMARNDLEAEIEAFAQQLATGKA